MAILPKRVRRTTRERTKLRIRKKVTGTTERPRLSVFKSGKHTYAQVICDHTGKTIAAASTIDADVVSTLKGLSVEGLKNAEGVKKPSTSTKSAQAAKAVGLIVANRCKSSGVTSVVFDRNGYVYHGRVQALADGAREGGLDF